MATEDTEKKREFHRVEPKSIYTFFFEWFFISFHLPLIKSALRMTEVESLDKFDCLSVASSQKITSDTSIFSGSQKLVF
ncbi:hypothetical protein [uncultured Ilyobacter sp.]|uniref:hypothetical protein n=1 Tax=uncultured Ilyobacter sp. TaxID=544433 RepID=UPI0029F50EE5|nr:hypothetical protein [uncultured Ilyobacter sp.]